MALVQPTWDLKILLTPDARTLGATTTATSQTGPKPGAFVPAQPSAMTLEGSGDLESTISPIEVATARAGTVGTATYRWRYAAEPLRDWDPPTSLSDWEFIDRSTTASAYRWPDACRLADGTVVAVVTTASNTVSSARQLTTRRWDTATVEAAGAATVASVTVDPDGRLYCIYAFSVATSITQLRMSYSDDGGDTWSVGSASCLSDPLAYASSEVKRIRARWIKGRIALVLWRQDANLDYIDQYVSSDGGATFTHVEQLSAISIAAPDLQVRDGTLYLATIEYDAAGATSTLYPRLRKSTSPSTPWSSIEAVDVTAGGAVEWAVKSTDRLSSAECALLVDDDGRLYLYGIDYHASAYNDTIVVTSVDNGETWLAPFISSAHAPGLAITSFVDASTYIKDLCVVPERGRAVLLHTHAANPGTADDSLSAAYLGGWTTSAQPEDTSLADGRRVGGWDVQYLPIDLPGDIGATWTAVSAGAPGATLTSTGYRIVCAGGENLSHYTQPSVSPSRAGIRAVFFCTAISGTIFHDVRISDGTNAYSVRVSVTTTSIVTRDLYAASDIDTETTTDGADGIAIEVSLSHPNNNTYSGANGNVTVRYRRAERGTALQVGPRADRSWTTLIAATNLTIGVSATSLVQFGIATGAAEGYWRMVAFSPGTYVAGADPDADPTRGRLLTGRNTPTHIVEGLRVHAVDGPTVTGDTWDHTTDHEYPVSALDPSLSPSPRRKWRATGATTQDITLTVDMGFDSGDLIGCFVAGANFRTASLYRDSTATNKVMDLDLAMGTTLEFTRLRDLIRPGTGSSQVPYYLHEGLLAGGTWYNGTEARKIRTNAAGSWIATAYTNYRSTRLYLEDYESGDVSSGATGEIWSPTGLFISNVLASTDTLMLRIPTQTVAGGYIEMGTLYIGRVNLLSRRWGNGRGVEWVPQVRVTQRPGGGIAAQRLGPIKRRFDVGWPDGIDTTGTSATNPDPEFFGLGHSSARPYAVPADFPMTLAGLIDATDGARLPVVLAPAVPQPGSSPSAASPLSVIDPHRLLYSRFTSELIRADQAMGDEHHGTAGEVFRMPNVRFEEIT